MIKYVRHVLLLIVNSLIWVWAGGRLVLDLIGRTTIYEDSFYAIGLVKVGLNWVFSTPWWVPAGLGAACTLATVFFLRPRSDLQSDLRELGAKHSALQSNIERLSHERAATSGKSRTWADERSSHRTEVSSGKFSYIFNETLATSPTIKIFEPLPGKECRISDISPRGFTANIVQWDHVGTFRFFADASQGEYPKEGDPVAALAGGRWYGDRLLFEDQPIVWDEQRSGRYFSPLTIKLDQCPPGVIAELSCEAEPNTGTGLRGNRFAIGRREVATLPVDDEKQVTFGSYEKTPATDKPFRLTIRLLSWYSTDQ